MSHCHQVFFSQKGVNFFSLINYDEHSRSHHSLSHRSLNQIVAFEQNSFRMIGDIPFIFKFIIQPSIVHI